MLFNTVHGSGPHIYVCSRYVTYYVCTGSRLWLGGMGLPISQTTGTSDRLGGPNHCKRGPANLNLKYVSTQADVEMLTLHGLLEHNLPVQLAEAQIGKQGCLLAANPQRKDLALVTSTSDRGPTLNPLAPPTEGQTTGTGGAQPCHKSTSGQAYSPTSRGR